MTARGDSLLQAPIDAKLGALVDALATKPSWYGRWQSLNPDAPEAERLAVYQAVRASGILPTDTGFYLVSWQIDAMASQYAESALRYLDDRLAAIRAAPRRFTASLFPGYDSRKDHRTLTPAARFTALELT